MTDERNSADEKAQSTNNDVFPIVGIGASAGGLEAFERFFTHIKSDTGMAFVIVQHLDPNHKSMLVELIERYTEMPVEQATNDAIVRPNTVYIIPPDRNMALENGRLVLTEPSQPRGLRLPIDFFFRSLARDQAGRAVCVVLSGTASDGALGVKAVKGEGGMAMAQKPETARYPGMPQSAIATNVIDFVLPPEEMPAVLSAYVTQAVLSPANGDRVIPETETDLVSQVFSQLRQRTGHDFSQYKRKTVVRRIERRMVVNQHKSLGKYLQYLGENPLEVDVLFKDMLIGVTRFFRDGEAFEFITDEVIASLVEEKADGGTIRIWVAGCSTGEEAYSLTILFYDAIRNSGKQIELQVFATDIDHDAIEKARAGYYPDNIEADIPADLLRRHFSQERNGYRVKKHIRKIIIFAEHSLIKDPPFSRLDLVSCRNLLIYLNLEIQKRVIKLFHYALQPGGYLFLGTSETPAGFNHLFDNIEKKWKVYSRLEGMTPRGKTNFGGGLGIYPNTEPPTTPDRTLSLEEAARQALMRRYTPPAVIINEQGNIVYFHDDTSAYLRPAPGTASLNILKMVISELQVPLSTGLRRMMRQRRETVQDPVSFQRGDTPHVVRIILLPLRQSDESEMLTVIVFEEVRDLPTYEITSPASGDMPSDEKDLRITELEQELRSSHEYLQTTIEELETTNEELKSANEELQSSNEEFQSTNEELETTKEELQSVNEELVTVNSELNAKIESLTSANNNQKNLMDNMDVGLIFLSDDLNVRLFNPIAGELLNLIPDDVGRPIRHFAANFDYSHFVRDCERLLDTLSPMLIEVRSHDDRWYAMQLRPYYTLDNDVNGLVVTFADITPQKEIQRQLETRAGIHRTLLEHLPETAILIFDFELRYTLAAGRILEDANFHPDNLVGKTLFEVLPEDRAQTLEPYYQAALKGERTEYTREFNGSRYQNIAAPVTGSDGTILAGMVIANETRIADDD